MSDEDSRRSARVPFPLWTPVTDLPFVAEMSGTIETGTGKVVGASAAYGITGGEGPQPFIQTWSFDALDSTFSSDWPARHAAMSFASLLARQPGQTARSAVLRLQELVSGPGDPVTLDLNGSPGRGVIYSIRPLGTVIASTDASPPFAAACTLIDQIPRFVHEPTPTQ